MLITHRHHDTFGTTTTAPPLPAALTIEVGAAVGVGSTRISAFDAALRELGVGEANLIRLSSVIPPHATIERTRRVRTPIVWGDRLYCVYAVQFADTEGESAAAGIGWTVREDNSGAGLFVEHEAESAARVDELIHLSLTEMTAARAGVFGPVCTSTIAATSDGRPTCALALAAYHTAGWQQP